jgi:hypothetical protein
LQNSSVLSWFCRQGVMLFHPTMCTCACCCCVLQAAQKAVADPCFTLDQQMSAYKKVRREHRSATCSS